MDTKEIQINLSGDGMGENATYDDALAYRDFVDARLTELYPDCEVTVDLAPEGDTVSRSVVLDESDAGDVRAVLGSLWDEFCSDASLWPSSTQVAPPDVE